MKLQMIRRTTGEYENGERFEVTDDWTGAETGHRSLGRNWTGVTEFLVGE